MTSPISRRRLIQGTAWASPIVLASTVIPTYAASTDPCEVKAAPSPVNPFSDGNMYKTTIDLLPETERFTFTLTGGAGGSYSGVASPGYGGAGAIVSGYFPVTQSDTVEVWLAGGGSYNRNQPTEPGKGWANGGSHVAAYMGKDSETLKYQNSYSQAPLDEFYSPTGGGASAIFLNGELMAVAGGGGGAGTRYMAYTVWDSYQAGSQPSGFKALDFKSDSGAAANGGSGTPNSSNGQTYTESFEEFVGPQVQLYGGQGGANGRGGNGGQAGSVLKPNSSDEVSFSTNPTHQIFAENVPGNKGNNARPDKNGGGDGASGVVGRAFINTWDVYSNEQRNRLAAFRNVHQGSIVHGATGGGGYGGGGGGSVTAVGAYATKQLWNMGYTYSTRWAPVVAAAFSGGAGAGGSYLSPKVQNGSISTTVGNRPNGTERINGTIEVDICSTDTSGYSK